MAYRADIEIAVRGAQELKRLQNEISATSKLIDGLNNYVQNIGSGGIVRNINNLKSLVADAASAFNKAALNTEEATIAARQYVLATNDLNKGLRERLQLIRNIEAAETAAQRKIIPTSNAGYGQQMPALPPAMVRAKEIQQSWNIFFTEAAELGTDLKTTAAAKAINLKQSWNTFFTEAAELGTDLKTTAAAKAINLKQSWNRFFQEALDVAVELQVQAQKTAANIRSQEGAASAAARGRLAEEAARRQRIANAGFGVQGPALPPSAARTGGLARGAGGGGGMAGRLGQALSSALIGGGFPLLFGQGAGAAVGGGLGGLAGGALGGGLGFGLSIVGTLLGDIASRGQAVKQLGQDLGFSAQQAQALASAFKTANTDVETFTAVIQNIRGLGLELEDQAELIKLTTTLTEKYGGQFDKVGNAITSALESGKVSQATLNQLTSQGINIQQALADKLGVSRDRLLEMAKKGQISVQDLVDTLVDVGNKGAQAVKKPATGIEMLGKASKDLGKAIGDLGGAIVKSLTPPFNWLAARLSGIISLAAQGIQSIANLLSGGTQSTAIANARARKLLFEETGGAAPMRGNLTVAQTARLRILETQQQKVVAAAETKIKPIDVRGLGQAAPSGGGSDKAAKDAARLAQQLQEQLRSAKDLVTKKQAELNLTKAISEEDKLKGKYEATRTERMQNYVKLLNKSLSDAERASLVEAQTLDIQISRMEYEKELSGIRKQQVENLYTMLGVSNLLNLNFERMASFVGAGKPGLAFNPNMNLVPSLTGGELGGKAEQARLELEKLIAPAEQLASAAEGIGSAFANSFKGVASGAMTAQEALSAFFQTVADRFLDMAAQIISKWIEMTILNTALSLFPGGGMFKGAGPVSGTAAFSGAGMGAKGFLLPQILPGRAAGGPVSAGSPYIVGERGPELFVPGRSGGIVPNDSLGMGSANVVVNVDASGSNVQGDGNQASQLGKAIGIAVQQELIKQKRPGGLLA